VAGDPEHEPGRLWFVEPSTTLRLQVADTAYIIFHHATGRVELVGFPTPDAAARAFWQAVARLAPPGWRLELPSEWGEGA
jgi:hypothetical protein